MLKCPFNFIVLGLVTLKGCCVGTSLLNFYSLMARAFIQITTALTYFLHSAQNSSKIEQEEFRTEARKVSGPDKIDGRLTLV